jgi:hypothetical protein
MLKKAKLYSLLAITLISTVIGLINFAPTFAQTADKDPKVLSATLVQDLKNDIYGTLMRQCLLNGQLGKITGGSGSFYQYPITKDSIASGSWLKDYTNQNSSSKDAVQAGYIVDPGGDGKLSCGGDAQTIIDGYKTAAGLTSADNYTIICTLGFRPVVSAGGTDPYKFTGDANMSVADCAKMATDPNVKGYKLDPSHMDSTDYTLPPEEQYVAYSYTLFNICKPSTGTPLGTTLSDVPVVYMDGTPENITYYMPSGSGDHKAGWDVSVFNNQKYRCDQLPDQMKKTSQAYAAWLNDPNHKDEKGTTTTTVDNTNTEKSTCQVTGIGWIVCPIINFVAKITDSAYSVLDTFFLKLPPVNVDTSDPKNGLYHAWSAMRDIANIVFVIAFLFLVFSQLTSIGISNYGIKRMVPKLIVAAILVNTSYFICAAAVDVSNIVGSSLKDFLDTLSNNILPVASSTGANGGFWSDSADRLLASEVLGGAAVVGGATLAMWAGFAVFIPLIFIVLPVLAAVLVAVLIRQAVVVLLIFISPLAFVAMLLPNTEDYFKKWREAFKVVLLFYPIVALVFGASALASVVLQAAAPDGGTDAVQAIQGIAAGAIRILPLIAIPALMKLVTGVLGRFSGIVNDPGKGWFDNRRNASVENGKIRRAGRVGAFGRWVNPTIKDADGKPIPDPDPRHKGVFGGSGSRRRQAVGALTAYGVNSREKSRKDRLAAAESSLEGTYLGSKGGQEARNAVKNAQISLQNAQINTDTIRINSAEGVALQQDATNAEKRQKIAQDESMTAAIHALPADLLGQAETAETRKQTADVSAKAIGTTMMAGTAQGQGALKSAEAAAVSKQTAEDNAKSVGLSYLSGTAPGQAMLGAAKNAELAKQELENNIKTAGIQRADENQKIQTETSSERLDLASNRDKQTYEEIAAQGAGTVSGSLGVDNTAAANAQTVRNEKKAVASAISTAANEGELAYSKEIRRGGPLLADAGGRLKPDRGQSRAMDRATSTVNRAEDEEVGSAKARILSDGDPAGAIDRAQQVLVNAIHNNDAVSARAAAQVLESKGNAGNVVLDDTIIDAESRGILPRASVISQSLRADLAGKKGSSSARDRWATDNSPTPQGLDAHLKDAGAISRLNEDELAGQQMHALLEAELAHSIDVARAQSVLNMLNNGTIKLPQDKIDLFNRVVSGAPPPPRRTPTPIPPPT